jgi:lysozyme
MRISQNCLEIIKKWEGFKLDAYLDPVGIATIGYGTIRYPDGQKVKMGDKTSEAEAEAFLKFEVDGTVASLNEVLKGINLNQNQFDALVSLCYNIGVGGFKGSSILKFLKTGDFKKASESIDLWNKGTINGVKTVLPGLVNRRKDERTLFDKKGNEGMPIEIEESPQDKVTKLEGFRDGKNNVIVAYDDKDQVIEILVLKSEIKEDFISTVQLYKNAKTFNFAPKSKKVPAGERIDIGGKAEDIPKVKNAPVLERSLLQFGIQDDDEGVSGNDVRELQQRLHELGYYTEKIDGIFGTATDNAVRNFQSDVLGIAEADGKVGKITWGKLWGEDSAKPKTTGTAQPGKNYLLLTKTATKFPNGLFKLKLEYIKDGQSKDFMFVNSGQPKRQFFRKGNDSVRGSFEPLPEGKWFIGDILWAGGKDVYDGGMWKEGIGPVKIPLDYVPKSGTSRDLILFHIDWNASTRPGTAGCVGIASISDQKRLITWLRDTDPRDLYVDWGLGSVKLP